MKTILAAAALLASTLIHAAGAEAGERYGSRPPVMLSPDLAAPWVMQLGNGRIAPNRVVRTTRQTGETRRVLFRRQNQALRPVQRQRVQQVSVQRPANPATQQPALNPVFLPQQVAYDGGQAAGTIVIDTDNHFLYLVQSGGTAMRYGVGVAKPGFEWAGTHKITRKAEWPSWTPPKEMISREAKKGHYLPVHMEGGPRNPLGARALYIGSTLYRIHGTNAPWTIGQNVSSGCIRMRNEDVTDLYARVGVGTRVVVK